MVPGLAWTERLLVRGQKAGAYRHTPASRLPQSFLDQRLSDTSVGTGDLD